MVKTVHVAEARDKLNEILAETVTNHHRFIVEQEGHFIAAIIPYEEFRRWQEILEDLEDLRDLSQIDRLWQEQPEVFMSLDEFNAELDLAEAAGELPA
jgi:prevent-host-death family protein